jgi:hypothetical protein
MLVRPHHSLYRHTATIFSVAQPLLAVSQKPTYQHAATLHPDAILRDPFLGPAQVLGNRESQSEPEQFIENKNLGEAKKPNLSNSLKTKGCVLARFFIENEAEHFVENKRH